MYVTVAALRPSFNFFTIAPASSVVANSTILPSSLSQVRPEPSSRAGDRSHSLLIETDYGTGSSLRDSRTMNDRAFELRKQGRIVLESACSKPSTSMLSLPKHFGSNFKPC